MASNRKTSSSLKVGILTIAALLILIFTVLWIKGRSLSVGERIEVIFHDVNGIRPGSGVQMMGLRIGQIEEIIPVVQGKDSHVKIRFVVTEKDVTIPAASTISIQQSGLIGEQFLEVMPPKAKYLYLETDGNSTKIQPEQDIYMVLSGQMMKIGKVESAGVIPTNTIPLEYRTAFKTRNTLKLGYIIDMPGLILDNGNLNASVDGGKLVFTVKNGAKMKAPQTDSPYTVIEPMRISDFLDLQYQAAHSLTSMNERVMDILSDDFIADIRASVDNVNGLTKQATSTLDKATALLDSSRGEIDDILKQTSTLTKKLSTLSDNINDVVGNEENQKDIMSAVKSVGKFAESANKVLDTPETKEMMTNLNEISRNLADISCYVNEFTGDEKLKKNLKETIENINGTIKEVNENLQKAGNVSADEQLSISDAVSDTVITAKNLRKFSEKLNKRFLIFRLMF